MRELYSTEKKAEKALCAGLCLKSDDKIEAFDSINELKALAETAGAIVIDTLLQIRNEVSPKYFIGKGLAEEIAARIKDEGINLVIFDNELTPVQVRNLEALFECTVIGRTELILDIFALRAKTNIAKLQVELAQLEFLRPRLRRAWTHLTGSQGGIGFRGPGETQLETDKRLVAKRISTIKNRLSKQNTHISNIHKSRKNENLICLVGYTNAGKSTLLSSLSKEEVFSKDMLFSTLDSTTRKVYIDDDFQVLISDTVGFIRKLPHLLVESFKSTLSEVTESKLLLHIIDVSRSDVERQIESVKSVLKEIGASDKNVIHVFNKTDKLDDLVTKKRLLEYSPCVFISALENTGLLELKAIIKEFFLNKAQTHL